MSYINVLKTAFIIFPLIALLVTMPYMFIIYRKYGSINKLRTLIIFSFILYMLCIYFLVILPLPDRDRIHTTYLEKINLIPFSFIYDFITKTPLRINEPSTYLNALKHSTFFVPLFNIIMTIPFGMYLRYYFKFDLKKTIIAGLLLSLFFELTQLSGLYFIYSGPYRLCDIDDLIMNTFGAIVGYYLFGQFKDLLPSRDKIDEDSIIKGYTIPNLRRLFAFIIDLIIIYLITSFVGYDSISFMIIFISYYSILEISIDKTIGMVVMRYEISFDNQQIKNIVLLNILRYFYYFGLINIISYIFIFVKFIDNNLMVALFSSILLITLFGYILYIIMIVLLNKKPYYDRILHTKYINKIY